MSSSLKMTYQIMAHINTEKMYNTFIGYVHQLNRIIALFYYLYYTVMRTKL